MGEDARRRPERVHIIGGMGTGKTHLARRLGDRLGAPVYEMDLDFDLDRTAVAGGARWVTEGIFLWQIEPLLEAADVVVWLDLPYRTCVRRIVVRHVVASARRNNRYKGVRRLAAFSWGARAYWKTVRGRSPTGPTDWAALSRAQTTVTLAPFAAKVHRLRSRREVDAWVDTVLGHP